MTAAGAVSVGPLDVCAPFGFVTGVVVRVVRVIDVRRRLAVRADPDPATPEPATAEVAVTDASGTDDGTAWMGETSGTRRMPLGSPVVIRLT